jgi:hypothetical protein
MVHSAMESQARRLVESMEALSARLVEGLETEVER